MVDAVSEIMENNEGQLVQTETTGLHEMKIYNQLRDELWSFNDILKQTNDIPSMTRTILQIQSILRRSDSLWNEINLAFQTKYKKLKITEQVIYDKEHGLAVKAKELNKYLMYLRNIDITALPLALLADPEFRKLLEMPKPDRVMYIQDRISDIVEAADNLWGESAVKAGINLPVAAKEERNMFFRYRKASSNPYQRRRF